MGIPYAEVIGDPIEHSKSPIIHKFWLEQLGLPGTFRASRIKGGALRGYLAERRGDPDWRGCNLTMPLKLEALSEVDRVDPLVARTGAANIIAREGKELVAYNSDVRGFIEPVAALLWKRYPSRAAVIGTGGAARAVLVALSDWRVESLVVLARRPTAARAMLDALGIEADIAAVEDESLQGASILVNATPAGMTGHPPLEIGLQHIHPDEPLIYDLVYVPAETPLLAAAKALPLAYAVNGLGMLIAQAAESFRRFFGAEPRRGTDDVLRRLLTR